jgi:hypothetical protein
MGFTKYLDLFAAFFLIGTYIAYTKNVFHLTMGLFFYILYKLDKLEEIKTKEK